MIRVLVVAIVALVVCGVPPAESQESGAKVAVDLGTADGPPGSTVFVPVNIAVSEGTSVSSLDLEVSFDKGLLSFVRADLTPEAKADGVRLTTSLEEDRDDESLSMLRVTATGSGELATSAIADLFFRISQDAKPSGSTSHKAGTITTVLKKAARVRTSAGELVAEGRDGEIDVTEGVALFGCFFYMH